MTTQAPGKGKKKNKDDPSHLDAPHGQSVANFRLTGIDWKENGKDITNVYLLAVFMTGVFQFIYVLLVGTFPFNAFLAGFISCVTSFVLGVSLKKTGEFKGFLFAHLVLHLAVLMLIG